MLAAGCSLVVAADVMQATNDKQQLAPYLAALGNPKTMLLSAKC
ncbi:hypothetical protein [Rhodopila sp.]